MDRDPATAVAAIDPAWAPFVALARDAPFVAFIKDADGRYVYANAYLLDSLADRMGSDWQGKTDADIWPPEVAAIIRANDRAALEAGTVRLFTQAMPFGDEPHALLMMKFPMAARDGRVYLGGIGVDQTAQVRLAGERDRLAAAVEQSSESVMIADVEARIIYVNPAFERVTGFTREEVLGKNPRILNSGIQPRAFYDAMWAALTSGQPWVADFVNRRKDGSLLIEEAVISPIRDASGAVTSYVAVKRDVTTERALEQHAARLVRERALIAETLRGLEMGDSPEATAQAFCRQLLTLTDVRAAQLFLFELDGRASTIGFASAGRPDPPRRRLALGRSRELRSRAEEGPWIQTWVAQPEDANFESLTGLGVHLVACAPLRAGADVIGLLVLDAAKSVDEAEFAASLAALVEFADLASALIGREVIGRTVARRARAQIQQIIDGKLFQPVFQPVVEMATGRAVGYEALTRFDDGVNPEVRFGEARAVGLGLELETATLVRALSAARQLTRSRWISINVSPALIVAFQPLQAIMQAAKRRLVLEVTEYAEIRDYEAFRAAVTDLGPETELAVDDAGSGFASMRHILELRPAFVKVDRSLISGLETDEARQAMVVGLRHFANAAGCELIAEGVETALEVETLRSLGVSLGQGYLLGRPIAAPAP